MHAQQDISFKSVDVESVESVEDNPEAVTFEIVLNAVPSSHWIEEFEYLYARASFTLKPPIHVIEDRMRVLYLPRYGDELQGYVTFLSQIVERATQETKRTLEILQTDEKEKVKTNFRSVLSRLELPGRELAKAAVAS